MNDIRVSNMAAQLGLGSVAGLFRLLIECLAAYCFVKIILAINFAFRGPLGKVPGPFWNRLSGIPWMIAVIKGKSFELGVKYNREYGDLVRVAPDLVLVADKHSIHQVIVDLDLRKSVLYEKFRQEPDGATLFTMRDRAQYRQRRRMLSHGFSVNYLKGIETLVKQCVNDFEHVLDAQCQQAGGPTPVDLWNLAGRLTSDIMSECSFGGSFKLVQNGEHPIRKKFSESFKRGSLYQLLPFLKYIPFMPRFQDPELRVLVDEILDRRRTSDAKLGRPDILQLLLDAHDQNPEQFNHNEVIAEMFVFLLAGSETSASTVTFVVMFLLNNPPAYRRLVDELRERFPLPDSPVSDGQTVDLPFLDAVIKETLRLMPPAASGLWRQTDDDLMLNNYLIPAGTRITANTTALHWDDKEWPDADAFVPERWLSDYKGMAAAEKGAYYPFSAGSRNCIGKQFALTELRIILASILRRYDLSLIPGQSHEVVHYTVLHLKDGQYMVDFARRQI